MPTFTITSTADDASDTSTGVDLGDTGFGSLRQAINFANKHALDPSTVTTIKVADGLTGTIMLKGNLPLVATSIQLDGGNLTLDGSVEGIPSYRGFLISGIASNGMDAAPTTVGIANLTIQNTLAKGGDGGAGGDPGGGGLGAGGAIFVGPAADVTLTHVTVSDTRAAGGNAGLLTAPGSGSGGGGGLTADGASAGGGGGLLFVGGDGGGGITSPGSAMQGANGGDGGKGLAGLGGGGGGGGNPYEDGDGGKGGGTGAGDGTTQGTQSGPVTIGGDGGFGGGGGTAGGGGNGGFGGGGGAGPIASILYNRDEGYSNGGFGGGGARGDDDGSSFDASNGGFGAGNAGGHKSLANAPGNFGGGGATYGSSSSFDAAGGGAGMGGAIFVTAGGKLTIAGDTMQSGGMLTPGAGSAGGTDGQIFGSSIFFEGNPTAATPATLTFGDGTQSIADDIVDLNGASNRTTYSNGFGPRTFGAGAAYAGGVTGLAKIGGGKLTLTGTNNYSGSTTFGGGTISVSRNENLGTRGNSHFPASPLIFSGGTLETTASFTSARAVTVNVAGTIQTDTNVTTTLTGTITDGSGLGRLTKSGVGTLLLSGGNTYSDGTALNAGTLELGTLGSAGSNRVAFGTGAQTLQLDVAGTLANKLMSFGVGDAVDLRTINPNGATMSMSGNNLTVTEAAANGSDSNTVTIGPALSGYRYALASDNAGGTNVFLAMIPTTPGAPMLTAASDTGASQTDRVTSNKTPTVTGSADTGATVTLYDSDGATVLGSSVARGGTYTITSSALADGTHQLTTKATTAAGGASLVSTATSIVIDTMAPPAPSAPAISGKKVGSDVYTNSNMPTATGTAEAGSTVTLYRDNAVALGSFTVGNDGKYTITPMSSLADGRHQLYTTTTDLAGNRSAGVAGVTYVNVQTTGPSASAPVLAAGSDTGSSASDRITAQKAPDVTGTTVAGATVRLYDTNGTTLLGTATAMANGTYKIAASALSEGAHNLTVIATDQSGTAGPRSNGTSVTIDTVAPGSPTIALDPGSDTGQKGDGMTSNATPTLTGKAEAGSSITLYADNAVKVGSSTAGTDGTYSVTSSTLSNGRHQLYATATDAAGNRSGPGVTYVTITPAAAANIASFNSLVQAMSTTPSSSASSLTPSAPAPANDAHIAAPATA